MSSSFPERHEFELFLAVVHRLVTIFIFVPMDFDGVRLLFMHFADFGIFAGRIDGLTGVWVDIESGMSARKICAFGVKSSRWVTMHGLALNVDSDLNFFDLIVPCGITDRGVTSISKEVGRKVTLDEVKPILKVHLQELFGWQYTAGLNSPDIC